MCLAIVAIDALPDWPLVIVANRDEFHAREASAAAPWHDASEVVAGRDLQAGGTWLGLTKQGRIALLTNYREPGLKNPLAPSRGRLVENYLRGDMTAADYVQAIGERTREHNGFNLLLADEAGVWYASNRSRDTGTRLPPGIVGLSNALLDTPWPKLVRSRAAVGRHLGAQHALHLRRGGFRCIALDDQHVAIARDPLRRGIFECAIGQGEKPGLGNLRGGPMCYYVPMW